MKHVNWESVLEQIDDDLLLEALNYRPVTVRSVSGKIVALAAALTVLCTLGLSACTVNLFGIRDLIMNLSHGTYVTVAGYQNSPEYLALEEWEARCPKRQSMKEPVPEDRVYHQYGAFSYSAKRILDDILGKYDLLPYNSWVSVYDGDPQSLYEALGTEGFLPESCSEFIGTVDPDLPGCSVRSGGTIFSFSDCTQLPDGTRVKYELNNTAKGYMPIFIGMHMNPDTSREWEYKTKDRSRVLLCIDEELSVILADFPKSFLFIDVSLDTGNTGEFRPLNEDQLEAFADLISYQTILKLG